MEKKEFESKLSDYFIIRDKAYTQKYIKGGRYVLDAVYQPPTRRLLLL